MVEFSVVHVPWERRLQTAAVLAFLILVLALLGFYCSCLFFPVLWVFYIPYVLFNYFIDTAPYWGGRPIPWVKMSTYWKVFAAYFPTSIRFQDNWHKNAEPDDQYVFAMHPHGVVSLGVWANVISNGGGLYDALPGLNLRVVTLSLNFFIPVWREVIMALGIIDSSESSITAAFDRQCSVGIVVGGAIEALDAVPGHDCKLTLKRRRGFIRMAMKSGNALVPVFSFGENDLYDQAKHPFLRRVQRIIKKRVGFSTPIFFGRGVFNYSFGLMPHRRKVLTVFGKPIPVRKTDSPSSEELDRIHIQYVKALQDLYYAYRAEFDPEDTRELIIH